MCPLHILCASFPSVSRGWDFALRVCVFSAVRFTFSELLFVSPAISGLCQGVNPFFLALLPRSELRFFTGLCSEPGTPAKAGEVLPEPSCCLCCILLPERQLGTQKANSGVNTFYTIAALMLCCVDGFWQGNLGEEMRSDASGSLGLQESSGKTWVARHVYTAGACRSDGNYLQSTPAHASHGTELVFPMSV